MINIALLILDSDGVLTDGGVYIDSQGQEMRRFNIKDGAGIKQLINAGVRVAIISSSSATPVTYRAQRLGIEDVYVGVEDKVKTATELLDTYSLSWSDVGFVGDDLADISLLKKVKYPIAVADAIEEVRSIAEHVLTSKGGHGAIRELSNLIVGQKKLLENTN